MLERLKTEKCRKDREDQYPATGKRLLLNLKNTYTHDHLYQNSPVLYT